MQSNKQKFGDQRSMIAMLSGVVFLILFMLVGLALDNVRASRVPGRLVAALDAAALGSAKLLDRGRAKDADISAHARALFAARMRTMQLRGIKLRDIVVHMNRSRSSVTVTVQGTVTPIFGRALSLASASFRQTSRMIYKSAGHSRRVIASVKRKMSDKGLAHAKILESRSGQVAAFHAAAKDVTSPSGIARGSVASAAAEVGAAPLSAQKEHETAATSGSEPEGGQLMRACGEPTPAPLPEHRLPISPVPLQLVGYARDCPSTKDQPLNSNTIQRDALVDSPAAPGEVSQRHAVDLRARYGFPDLI